MMLINVLLYSLCCVHSTYACMCGLHMCLWLASFKMFMHMYQISMCTAKFILFNFYCEVLVWVAIDVVCGLGVCRSFGWGILNAKSPRRETFYCHFLDGVSLQNLLEGEFIPLFFGWGILNAKSPRRGTLLLHIFWIGYPECKIF